MRDDAKTELNEINNQINKAKTSLEKMEDFDELKTLQAEFVDMIPLGQFPEDEDNEKAARNQKKPQ